MKKPDQIIKIENILKIVLSEYTLKDYKIGYIDNRNTYEINNVGEIIGLNLIGNNINDIYFLEDLAALKSLSLAKNKISDLSPIKNLKLLENLDLDHNEIKDISSLSGLTNLTSLIIWRNKISNISALKKLNKLSFLDLSYNHIYDISVMSNFSELTELILWGNIIDDISSLEELNNLKILNLGANQINDVSNLKNLKSLKEINLEYNSISDITTLLKIKNLENVFLNGNKKIEVDFPAEVLNADWQAVKLYSENSKKNVPFKNVKILLLGNPNIGKSNLLEYLETNEIPQRNELTHGVVYKKITINDINFHIWDFGGQEYFHATHKLFFSPNALNIVLWGKHQARINEELNNQNFDLDYWLRTIEQLTKIDKPQEVLVIENKTDLNNPKYSATPQNQIKYVENYKSLHISFLDLCLLELKKTENFKDSLIQLSKEIISNFNYPAFFEVFWKRIENLDKDFVTIEEINNRPRIENTISAVKIFHNMGMLLYFPDIIANKVFVKPQALLELLYEKVLGQDKKDRLSKIEIQNAISGNSLQLSVEEIIALLKYFDLCFEIHEEKNTYFIPQYLKEQNPFVIVFEKNTFEFCNIKVKSDHYLMSLAMLKVFTKYGNNVKSKDNKDYLFWNNGIIIEKEDQILMIKFDRENQTIELYQSKNNSNFNLQREIIDFILKIPHVGAITIKSNYSKDIVWDVNWNSTYFDVLVSINGEYYVSWKKLEEDQELTQIKTYKYNTLNKIEDEKIEETSRFNKFLFSNSKDIIMLEKESEKPIINNILNFNGNVNNHGTIASNVEQATTHNISESLTKSNNKLGLSSEEEKALKNWKNKSLFLILFALFFTILAVIIYFYEFAFIMSPQDWTTFKNGKSSNLIIYIITTIWTAWILKMIYDRFYDVSKENSFIDLYRKKNK
ncbi:leucine-rich repeat domain-containing protein [Flavobacterium sp. LHD-85]|uniref:leucine-rich repeat domain-containing protein n=1 Tax=Flavobacterium sp. LHD-85 TaxID=3071410 RepID=UPI0027E17C60|nr:leucine-rich repeat domain-containing protein [Flavobacterium sp. LHD-85]MDQ6529233.1 leucine-rich repeat domain-containing protein [Flavobacterium sp. LHD-85]